MRIKAVKGMKDILPDEAYVWQRVEQTACQTLASYGYRQIRTPILEPTQLFSRTIGEGTDIVSKEMYTFTDQGGSELTLRPEATAAISRAYVEHHLNEKMGFAKLYLLGPMFRTERPQAARQRQFHQISTEVIGSSSPLVDVEVIVMLADLLKNTGLDEFTIRLGTVGCHAPSCRPAFVKKLDAYVKNCLSQLGPECKVRYPKRIWRILDCKNDVCRKLMQQGPSLIDAVRKSSCDCAVHLDQVCKGLEASNNQPFEVDPYLVRGLDYYTKTTFEVTAQGLGAQDAVAAGGRYDGLVKLLEGPAVGGVGMAVGLERLILSLQAVKKQSVQENKSASIYFALLGDVAVQAALPVVRRLRELAQTRRIAVHMNYETNRSLKSQLREANRLGCRWVVMIGEREVKEGKAALKDLANHKDYQHEIQPTLFDFFMEKMH